MIAETLGHYRIVRLLGKGGMGEVYVAQDTVLRRSVALKVLPAGTAGDSARRDRFEREARAVAALNHPSIVTIHSVEEADGVPFLTMELVEGRPLSELIPPQGMALDRFLQLALPLADAVSAAHRRGIVHRDLKPANVMVTDEGRLKVLDFGLAKLKETEYAVEGMSTLPTWEQTSEGRIVGTIAYMSPEQAEGKAVDARSDIFSLGIVLYEMVTGCRPFQGDTSVGMLSAILKDTPVTVADLRPEFPSEVGRIIRRCLEKDPTRRMQSALDLRNELEDLKNDLGSGLALRATPVPAQPARELVERYRASGDTVHLGALFERYSHLALGVSLLGGGLRRAARRAACPRHCSA
jgi:serine/threonine protein kinase